MELIGEFRGSLVLTWLTDPCRPVMRENFLCVYSYRPFLRFMYHSTDSDGCISASQGTTFHDTWIVHRRRPLHVLMRQLCCVCSVYIDGRDWWWDYLQQSHLVGKGVMWSWTPAPRVPLPLPSLRPAFRHESAPIRDRYCEIVLLLDTWPDWCGYKKPAAAIIFSLFYL